MNDNTYERTVMIGLKNPLLFTIRDPLVTGGKGDLAWFDQTCTQGASRLEFFFGPSNFPNVL
jgi:hypothetical protein